jgi:hypothetical protein
MEIEPKNIYEIYKTTIDGIWFLVFKDEKVTNHVHPRQRGYYTNTANVIRILNVIEQK